MQSSKNGKVEVVRMLLAAGASVTAVDAAGRTAAAVAQW
jgi:hypothetical protein